MRFSYSPVCFKRYVSFDNHILLLKKGNDKKVWNGMRLAGEEAPQGILKEYQSPVYLFSTVEFICSYGRFTGVIVDRECEAAGIWKFSILYFKADHWGGMEYLIGNIGFSGILNMVYDNKTIAENVKRFERYQRKQGD